MPRQFEDRIKQLAKIRINEEFKNSLKNDLMERVAKEKPVLDKSFGYIWVSNILPF